MINSTTTDPQLTQINLFYKKEFYQNATNFLSTIGKYTEELETAIDYGLTKVKNDVVTSQKEFFIQLDNKLKQSTPQFAAFWKKTFDNALLEVKKQVNISIGSGTFYRPISDSIGSLLRIENYLDDSLQLVSDLNGSDIMTPVRYGATLTNKISPSTLLLISELSKRTNLVFRKNLQNIQSVVADSTTAHGENLVPDTQHFVRMQNSVSSLTQKIQSEFKELYSVISYYCNYNPRSATTNLQFVPNIQISVNVEGNNLNQDLLFNQLKEVNSGLTSQKVLGTS